MNATEWKKRIEQAREGNHAYLTDEMNRRLAIGDIYILYDVQIFTNNLLRYASLAGQIDILDGLAELYLISARYLTRGSDGTKWVYTDGTNGEIGYLLNKEIPLISSQFLCAVTECAAAVAKTPAASRTAAMNRLVNELVAVAVDFYDRWYDYFLEAIDQTAALPFPPADDTFVSRLPIYDDLLFLFAGMAHLMGAQAADPSLGGGVEIPREKYRVFLDRGCALLRGRLTASALTDFSGNAVEGLNFDLGVWDGYEDYEYAGYAGQEYPTAADKRIAQDVGWDISHARRFVNAFDALYDNRVATGLDFPDEGVLRGLANQLVYGTFNRDFARPLFTNFMDGTNGWYRVGYAGREQFGYAPYDLSDAAPTGGYGFWSRFNPDVARVMHSIAALAERAADADPEDRQFAGRYYKGFEQPGSLAMLMFLPSVAEYR